MKKIEVDTSCLGLFNEVRLAGREEDVDYYIIPINRNASFVAESNHETNTVDLLLTTIMAEAKNFIKLYLSNRHDEVYCNLQGWKINNNTAAAIRKLSDFAETYKATDVSYSDLLYIAKAITQ